MGMKIVTVKSPEQKEKEQMKQNLLDTQELVAQLYAALTAATGGASK